MKKRFSAAYAIVMCGLIVLSLVAPVGAAEPAAPEAAPTITFEESIPNPQVVRSQYCNNPATNMGVEFLDVGGHIFEPAVSTASPTHALTNIFPGEEFQMDRWTKISFTAAQSDVSVKVGLDHAYAFEVTARLMAFTTATPQQSSLVAFDEVVLGQGPTPITSLLSVSRTQGDIRSVSVDTYGPGVGVFAYEVIDDLSYSIVGPPCVADTADPTVTITKPPVDGWAAHTPTTEIAFSAWDSETGISQVRIYYLDDQGGQLGGFTYCGGPHTTPCGSAGSTVSGNFMAELPAATETIRVEADDFAGHTGHADRIIDLVLPSASRNLWLQGLEITQATQNWVPEQTQTRRGGAIPATWVYPSQPTAVPLVAGHTTVARVYASVEDTGIDIPLVGATARLRCYTDANFTTPCPGQAYLTSQDAVTVWPTTALDTKRGQANLSWNFVLPALWTWMWAVQPPALASTIYLEAEVVAPGALPECAGCADAANRMRVAGVDFTATESFWPRVKVLGYNWTVQGQTFNLDPNDVTTALDFIRKTYPIEEATVPTSIWVGTYDDGKNLGPTNPGSDGERCDALLDFAKGGYSSLGKYKRLALIVREFPCAGLGSMSEGHAFARVSQEDIGAHELGHACGIRHCGPPPGHGNECGSGGWCDDDWPWPHGTLGHYGFDTVTMQAIIPGTTEADRHDVMSYGGSQYWISPRNWTRLFNVFANASVPIPGADVEGAAATSDYLWVRGRMETGTGWILQPAYELELPAGSNDAVGEGEYRIELLDGSGQVLSERHFSPELGHIDGIEPETAIARVLSFNEVLPLPAGVTTIALRHEADTLASRSRSAQWPTVTVLSPTAAGFQGQPQNPMVAWSGHDADDDLVYYLIQYTTDPEAGAAAEWQTLGIDVEGEALPVSLEGLAGSDNAMVRILASDGFNTTSAASPTFAVSDKPPGAQILSPETEASLNEGERLVLRGTAFDREDGLLEGEALSWYDYGAALLGTGRRLDVSTLAPGDHAIVLVAEDSTGQMDMEVVSVTVVERPNTQPVADAGPDRSTGVGSPVTLFGAWSSDADGDPLTYHWEVTDQPEGSQAVLSDPTAVLPGFSADQTGSYEVTLVVNDGQVSSLPDPVSVVVGAAGSRIYLDAPESQVTVSDTVRVEIRIDAIEDLYAAQVELSFDPSLLQVEDAQGAPGIQIEEGDFPVPDAVLQNAADNTAGRVYYTISLQGIKPGVNGSGRLATITFRGLQEGLSRLVMEQVVLSDPQSQEIEVRVEDGVVWVEEPLAAAVAGRAILERRSSDAGVEATIGGRSTTTGESGEFVLLGAPAGTQTLTLRRESYLATWRQVALAEGQTLSLPDVTLLGGDVNGDDLIGLVDGGEIGLAWNATPASPEWSGAADITDDGTINVLDAVAVHFNWLQAAPGPWAGAMVADAAAPSGYDGLLVPEATTRVAISQTLATLAGVGDGVELQIRVEDVERMYGGHVIVEFDPAVLRVRDTDPRPSAPGVQVRPGDFLDLVNRFELVNRADNGAGTIEYAMTQLNPAEARTGSGVLATIVFEGRWPGSSPVHVSLVELIDDTRPTPQLIPASTQDGQVTVADRWSLFLPLVLKNR